MTSQQEAFAYCAGVIDSDGTIGIKRYTSRHRTPGSQPSYTVRISVMQVSDEAVRLLVATLTGTIVVRKKKEKRPPYYYWAVSDLRAERALIALLPYLRIKKSHAENCLALRKLVAESKTARFKGRWDGKPGGARRPVHIGEAMERIWLRARELNAPSFVKELRERIIDGYREDEAA